jgi:hypothetical protein
MKFYSKTDISTEDSEIIKNLNLELANNLLLKMEFSFPIHLLIIKKMVMVPCSMRMVIIMKDNGKIT